ncbi:MAG: MBOAT family O-acyltransferase [Clostridia bacterium]
MLFNSIGFLIYFIIVIIGYFLIPKNKVWIWLLGASYYFYIQWNIKYALLMFLSTLITYISGIVIDQINKKYDKKQKLYKKIILIISLFLNLSILFFFKYYNFIGKSILEVAQTLKFKLDLPMLDLILPVGISFYTFQALSYTLDVYKEDIEAEYHLGKYSLFVSFFPQLVAGPIERSTNLLPQIKIGKNFDYDRLRQGLLIMGFGFFKKIVIADRLAVISNQIFENPTHYSGILLIIGVMCFSFQIYCDFSGYSDIAIGCAKVMGYDLMENFNKPYFSKTIGEFWRRWHISLGMWFKDYLYIPLGGKYNGKLKYYRNLLIVFFISGLWHGASWNFAIWGLIHAIYQIIGEESKEYKILIINKLKINSKGRVYKNFQILTTFILVTIAWIFFRANTFNDVMYILNYILKDITKLESKDLLRLGLDKKDLLVCLSSVIGLLFVEKYDIKNKIIQNICSTNILIRWGVYYSLIMVIIVLGYYGESSIAEFIYFQF